MADINKNNQQGHPAFLRWRAVSSRIRALIDDTKTHPAQVVVIVPYAQLIGELRAAWLADAPAGGTGFMPQFQSTQNWAQSVGASSPLPDDVRMDPALDALTARVWLKRAGLAAHTAMLVPKLMDAAWSLVPLAASMDPAQRLDWSTRSTALLAQQATSEALAFENAVAQLALTWVGHSAFAADSLFALDPPLLVVLQGFHNDPLTLELARRFGNRCHGIALHDAASIPAADQAPQLSLYAALDAQDEAQMAAACIVRRLAAGIAPVALVAIDRLLTRRVQALLEGHGIVIRDETGWKLSTTRAAARVKGFLQACVALASTDDVLNWMKDAPVFERSALRLLEAWLRRNGVNIWPLVTDRLAMVEGLPASARELIDSVNHLRGPMANGRRLRDWLSALRQGLVASGQWPGLMADAAGLAVIQHLLLDRDALPSEGWASFDLHFQAHEFSSWASQALEAAQYVPPHPEEAQVIVLPLSQLLGRSIPATVMAGCDEVRLPMSPQPAGPWSHPQRTVLGLADKSDLALAQRAAWNYAIQLPHIDMVWRRSEAGETILPSGFVQELQLQPRFAGAGLAPDPRVLRPLIAEPAGMASTVSSVLSLERLSHSAYSDLRKCPYRFFALRQLALVSADELDGAVDKRDFGTWLHRVLFLFHESLKDSDLSKTPVSSSQLSDDLERAAAQAMSELGLTEVEFLPFSASWPAVRNGYLRWLAQAENHFYSDGEVWREIQLGPVKLVGKLDRIDHQPGKPLRVLDYKTEALVVTQARVKAGSEDTQLLFYAALVDDMTVEAQYVNIGEKAATQSVIQPSVEELRADLAQGILDDMLRIGQGHPMVAMGQGKACDFCEARGLCRKDMVWTVAGPC